MMIKSIITTFTLTSLSLIFVVYFFLNSILGVFGLTSIPLGTLSKLNHSQQVIESIKKRHQAKKTNASKKFIKKSSRKVISTAVAASTIGTAAVVLTVASLEVADYCDQKQALLDDENILYDHHSIFDYKQCMTQGQEESVLIIDEAQAEISRFASNALEDTKQFNKDLWDKFQQWIQQVNITPTP